MERPPHPDDSQGEHERYPEPAPEPPAPPQVEHAHKGRGWLGPLLGLAFLIWKFGKWALIAVKGSKFLTTALTMVISIGVYALAFGWLWAAGFVLLIFVHEMGHVWQLRREGIAAGAPVFVPFLGAAIAMKDMPRNALVEARVGLAGPIVGSAGALLVYAAALQYDSAFLQTLAYVGFFLNLFNLLPVSPLDGGRALGAVHPHSQLLGMGLLLGYIVLFGVNPILLLILFFGGLETWNRMRHRGAGHDYYKQVSPRQRMGVFVVYVGLAIALALLMQQSFIDPDSARIPD